MHGSTTLASGVEPRPGEHYVYSLYSSDRNGDMRLIYVGVTSNLTARLKHHRRKWWWPAVDPANHEFERFATRAEADAYEAQKIVWAQPAVNVAGRLAADVERWLATQ